VLRFRHRAGDFAGLARLTRRWSNSFVGTRDLGQAVYVALAQADAGVGLIAGLSTAFLRSLPTRLIQAAVARSAAASR
ncbi:hypothetical protein, partial [Mesorhizobium sp.]|uniref:hypothetical protein n=1 Tax=Mesorhizobium sp. TaxID=1871066 RepID=UPI0025C6A33D